MRGVDDGAILPALLRLRPRHRADAVELCGAGPASLEREVTVVTDPHYNTLVSHEIIGHPVELDRGLKMETAYAGRSWLLRGLDDTRSASRSPRRSSPRIRTRPCPATVTTSTTTRGRRPGA